MERQEIVLKVKVSPMTVAGVMLTASVVTLSTAVMSRIVYDNLKPLNKWLKERGKEREETGNNWKEATDGNHTAKK